MTRALSESLQTLTPLANGVNAYTLSFDDRLLNELRTLYETEVRDFLDLPRNAHLLRGGHFVEERWQRGPYKFYAASYEGAPLLWVSSDNFATYEVFTRFFRSLDIVHDIAKLIDFHREIVVYCGFFVVGEHLREAKWHVDYFEGANAFTLIAPLFELDIGHGNLLYKDDSCFVRQYRYKSGEAILLGEGFAHTTEPYQPASQQRVLVSLTFGTDKLDHWNVLKETAGAQSDFLILPCGHERGTCNCLKIFEDARTSESQKTVVAPRTLASYDRVVISPHVRWRESEGPMELRDARGVRLAKLDPTGARMWMLFARYESVAAVRADLLTRYDVEPSRLDQDLAQFVRSLADAGLMTQMPRALEDR
jgi:hypothetical protein